MKLSAAPGFYRNPASGADDLTFVDELSLPSNRIFGQGAELRMERFVVLSRRSSQ